MKRKLISPQQKYEPLKFKFRLLTLSVELHRKILGKSSNKTKKEEEEKNGQSRHHKDHFYSSIFCNG